MKLLELEVKNIKGFSGNNKFIFKDSKYINTISGKNGSGKTTIFEALTFIQRAYFLDILSNIGVITLEEKNITDLFNSDIYELLSDKNAFIAAKLKFDYSDLKKIENKDHKIPLQVAEKFCNNKELITDILDNWEHEVSIKIEMTKEINENIDLKIIINNMDNLLLKEFWNLSSPKNIIVFMGADKNVIEKDINFEDIILNKKNQIHPCIRFIFEPNKIYSNLYSSAINDHLYERIDPRKGYYTKYFQDTKIIFKEILNNVEISNISTKERINQIIICAKKDNKKMDIRNLSSGEKLIWYTFLLLNYVKDMGILIIDEPENHLHEELTCTFINELKKICSNDANDAITLSQIYLLTHSKNLIYNNFIDGKNYVVSNKEMLPLEYNNCEKELRKIGVSYTNDKILFVEGRNDTQLIEEILATYNIHVRDLGNCTEVIKVYNSIKKLANELHDPQFIFLIDRDSKTDEDIILLKENDPTYFDNHFIVMEMHEMENYLLDVKVIKEFLNHMHDTLGTIILEEEEIENIIKENANKQLKQTKQKFLNNKLQECLSQSNELLKQSEIPIDNKNKFNDYIDCLLSKEKWEERVSNAKSKFIEMGNEYSLLNWEPNWRKLCDGKTVFSISMNDISKKSKLNNKDLLIQNIKNSIINNENSDLNKFIEKIIAMYIK